MLGLSVPHTLLMDATYVGVEVVSLPAAKAVRDSPGLKERPKTQLSSPKTAQSKLCFSRTLVASARTGDCQFELRVGCLRN